MGKTLLEVYSDYFNPQLNIPFHLVSTNPICTSFKGGVEISTKKTSLLWKLDFQDRLNFQTYKAV